MEYTEAVKQWCWVLQGRCVPCLRCDIAGRKPLTLHVNLAAPSCKSQPAETLLGAGVNRDASEMFCCLFCFGKAQHHPPSKAGATLSLVTLR